MSKPKFVNQLFREGLKGARLRFGADRGRELEPPELGEMVGKSGQTIRNYESGHSEPELLMIEKLRVALNAPAEWPPFASYVPKDDGGWEIEPRHPRAETTPHEVRKPATKRRKA